MIQQVVIALYVLTTSSALVILKLAAGSGAPVQLLDNKLQFNINPLTITGVALFGLSFMLYTYLISKYDLGYIIPVATAFVYILIFFASFIIFKEPFTAFKIVGIALILGGLAFLSVASPK